MKYSDKSKLVEGLRELADFAENHPELPIDDPQIKVGFWVYDSDTKSAKERLADAARAMGKAEKRQWADYFDLSTKFGPVTLEFTTPRANVCKRVVTGTKIVPAKVIEQKERIEETVEWICDEPLLAS